MKTNKTYAARITALAAAQRASLPAVTVGTRVRWDGDMANDPGTGTVTAIEGSYMRIQWDGDDETKGRTRLTPLAIFTSPRWHVLPT